LIIEYLSESELRQQGDRSTTKMLNLWNQLCVKEIGKSLEVAVFNRRDSPDLAESDGIVNTNYLTNLDDKRFLGLFLEDISNINYMIVTHELGHWILKLQGIKGVVNNDETFGEAHFGESIENLLNSLCSHPALYTLQRSLGHEPRKLIDSRANHDIVLVSKINEPDGTLTQTKNALLFADDLINCSEGNRKGLQRVISKNLPRTAEIVKAILETKGTRDLSVFENANMLPLEIIRRLHISGNWSAINSIDVLKDFVFKPYESR